MPGERARAGRPTVLVADAAEFFGEVLPAKVDRKAAVGLDLVVQFVLAGEGGGIWLLEVRDGEVTVTTRSDPTPDAAATVRASAADFTKIVNGELSGADAFISQQLAVEGDLDAAAGLMALGIL